MVSSTIASTASPTPAVPWHVGITPQFPSSLTLTNDQGLESLLSDIPFLSVGLLAFGVLTFMFAMGQFPRKSMFLFGSVILAFAAGVLDVGQVLLGTHDTQLSAIMPYLKAREVTLSLSIGLRFLYFWCFVTEPPRGELASAAPHPKYRPNFLRLESYSTHSSSWEKWGFLGIILKFGLLLAAIAVPVLQILWRAVGKFSRFGPIYNGESTVEIVLSAVFILKLLGNSWMSPLTPRWKTVRDYSPVLTALFISLGVAIGQLLCFQFSETPLGRFFQAVELYILVLYIVIATFYGQRTRRRSRSSLQLPDVLSSEPNTGIVTSTPPLPRISVEEGRPAAEPYEKSMKRYSSWVLADSYGIQPRFDPQASTAPPPRANRLASWLSSRLSMSVSGSRRVASLERDLEAATSAVSLDEKRTSRSDTAGDASRAVTPAISEKSQPVISRTGLPNQAASVVKPPESNKIRAETLRNLTVPSDGRKRRSSTGSPVYGLDGIMRYHGKDTSDSRQSRMSNRSSDDMESLLRQQAELDKSVAGLQLFSPRVSQYASGGTVPTESFRSDFTLSNFPNPPLLDDPKPSLDRKDNYVVEEVPFDLVSPRIPAADSSRQQSFPSTTRGSDGVSMLDTVSGGLGRNLVDSNGTQYDVTSFIGGLTTPMAFQRPSIDDIQRRPSPLIEVSDVDTVDGEEAITPTQVTAPAIAAPRTVNLAAEGVAQKKGKTNYSPKSLNVGLPSRPKMAISGPIPQGPRGERPSEFERPRAVPAPSSAVAKGRM